MMQSNETSNPCFCHCCICQAGESSLEVPYFGCAKCCSYSIPSNVQYDDFTLHTRQKDREPQIHSGKFKGRKLNTYSAGQLWQLTLDIGYYRSTRLSAVGSTSTTHAKSSPVNHPPAPFFHILHTILILSSFLIFTSFHSNPFSPSLGLHSKPLWLCFCYSTSKAAEISSEPLRKVYRVCPTSKLYTVHEYRTNSL